MLKDKFSRRLDYLRVSVTDKCNLRCKYCMPEDIEYIPNEKILRVEEFVEIIGIFTALGIKKIRFTGGEPLLRQGIRDIISGIKEQNTDIELCLTTNGILLDEYFNDFIRLGIRKINISLDSVQKENYIKITGKDYFNKVISNIEKALNYDFFKIKINTVLHDTIYDELDDIFNYFKEKNIILRFIEKMPFPGSRTINNIQHDDFIEELKKYGKIIRNKRTDTSVAKMYSFSYKNRFPMQIGIIPPISHCFCQQCNRLRLTCDGFLRTCLLSDKEYNLKLPYRSNFEKEALNKIIFKAVAEKPGKHNLNNISEQNTTHYTYYSSRVMSEIGG